MDQYLKPNESLRRLINDYRKHGSLVIAYDFDNTVYDYHNKGEKYEEIIWLLRKLKSHNCELICWTANEDLGFIKKYLIDNDIPFDAINENPYFFKDKESRKIYYNALLDDRAGLQQVYTELDTLCYVLAYFPLEFWN